MSRVADTDRRETEDAAAVRGAVRGVLVTHGGLAVGLVDAVRRIAGLEPGALEPLSNEGMARDELCDEIRRLAGDGPTVVFTDLEAGSCTVAARMTCRECAGMVVVTGVNLPMLLEFVFNRDKPLSELARRLTRKGCAAIEAVASDGSHGDRSLSD